MEQDGQWLLLPAVGTYGSHTHTYTHSYRAGESVLLVSVCCVHIWTTHTDTDTHSLMFYYELSGLTQIK